MVSVHRIIEDPFSRISNLDDGSVELVVTSPPYPMVRMWDAIFSSQVPGVAEALASSDGPKAFELMHSFLDGAWAQVYRILKPGAVACINIGDAVRTLGKRFRLYNSHSRILLSCAGLGFEPLPAIIWRKPTNAPNKFLGSGMMPANAYVTLEHEHILILRKEGTRQYGRADKELRQESAYFWEERNGWFSDVWTGLTGERQKLSGAGRDRSGAFPLELAYRLVNMFSVKGDTVVDPFLGTGTTTVAAIASERNSIGYEPDAQLAAVAAARISSSATECNRRIRDRFCAHEDFVGLQKKNGRAPGYVNRVHGFPVITRQERGLIIRLVDAVSSGPDGSFEASYRDTGGPENAPDRRITGFQSSLFREQSQSRRAAQVPGPNCK